MYLQAGGTDYYNDLAWTTVHREIEAIVTAKSNRAAGITILWWGCWCGKDAATKFARQVRKAYRMLKV